MYNRMKLFLKELFSYFYPFLYYSVFFLNHSTNFSLSVLSGENNKRKCKKREYSFRKDFNPLCNAQMRIHLHFAASRGDRSRQPREVKHTYLPSGLECFYWTKVSYCTRSWITLGWLQVYSGRLVVIVVDLCYTANIYSGKWDTRKNVKITSICRRYYNVEV